jgi:hypothetical protein
LNERKPLPRKEVAVFIYAINTNKWRRKLRLSNKLTFRISSKEKRRIQQEAKKANERTLSDYIRKIIATHVRSENASATR